MSWTASPSGTVWRKRLHLLGPQEAGQVTSVVRYEKNSSFPPHEHPDGEEIFVLEGVFSDEHGDWPAGSYLLNPEGVRHAPFSEPGCTIFVKLRQYPGTERLHLATDTANMEWQTHTLPGVEQKPLYQQDGFEDCTVLQRWTSNINGQTIRYAAGAEIFILAGNFEDEYGRYQRGDWMRLPKGFAHSPVTDISCVLYLKEGGFAYMNTV